MKDEILRAMRDEASKVEEESRLKRQELKVRQAAKMLAESKSLEETTEFADACYPHIEAVAKELEERYGDRCDVLLNDKPEALKTEHRHGAGVGLRVTTGKVEQSGENTSAYFWVSPGTDGVLYQWRRFGLAMKPNLLKTKPSELSLKNCLKTWAVEVVSQLQASVERERK